MSPCWAWLVDGISPSMPPSPGYARAPRPRSHRVARPSRRVPVDPASPVVLVVRQVLVGLVDQRFPASLLDLVVRCHP